MIACDKKYLMSRCLERGYTLEEVMGCVVKQEGDFWWIDETHPDYPRQKEPIAECLAGTEIKAILSWLGIKPTGDCPCESRAAYMDAMGCKWVKENVEEVVGWLEEEAAKRRIPFARVAGRMLVLQAVRRAEQKTLSPA
jgi:hypothetical protein